MTSKLDEVKEKKTVNCPICESRRVTLKFRPRLEIFDPAKLYGAASGIPGTQWLVRCEDCSLIYESPRFSDDIIIQGYMSSEEGGHDSQYPMRVESFYRALVSLRGRIPESGGRVLDIGTAGGAFLDAAKRFGYEAWGLEPSQFLVNRGKERGLQIEQGTIDNHQFKPASFDMVCLWDVIEHLTHPRSSLEKLRKLLKPSGILLLNYPDIGTLQAKLAGSRFWWILSVHLQHFTKDTIREICARTGFETFYFQRYWQILKFGYLQDMAIHYRIPLAKLFRQMTPTFIQNFPLKYYASQTTALARLKS
jgi:SAM-dependent methyltransferase/DNA-directed RNA polymerase subunit RPC12/RpoP